MRIAALLTCFNRREKTLKCLGSLFGILPTCEVFLVDDGCTDGTREAVEEAFPQVHVIAGAGNLFWSRGMYTAWVEAVKQGPYDFYLWLNDDVELYAGFFDELLACNELGGGKCVVAGLIEDFDHKRILYGGSDASKRLIHPNGMPQDITFMNGNVVLVPQAVVDCIGIIDPVFHHDLGDVDYGLTAREHGIRVLSTRRPVACGYSNNFCRVRKWGSNLCTRMKKLNAPLGSPPRINFYFRRKHFGWFNAVAFVSYVYVLNLLPDWAVARIWGDAYKDK